MLTYDEDTVSDLYKNAYGFRPHQAFWTVWSTSTPDEKQAMWDDLLSALDSTIAENERQQAEAIAKFEALINSFIEVGADDAKTAFRWLFQASSAKGDHEYFEYLSGLPYGYTKKFV
jgi:hypothetical protein